MVKIMTNGTFMSAHDLGHCNGSGISDGYKIMPLS